MCKCHPKTQLKPLSFIICKSIMPVITSSVFKYKGNCVHVGNFEL